MKQLNELTCTQKVVSDSLNRQLSRKKKLYFIRRCNLVCTAFGICDNCFAFAFWINDDWRRINPFFYAHAQDYI